MHHIYLFEQNFLIVNMFKLCTLNLFRYYWSVSQTHWDRPVLRYILKTRLKMVTWQTFRESDVKTLLFIVLGPDLSQCSALWWADDSWGSPKLHSRRSELRSRVGLQSGGQKKHSLSLWCCRTTAWKHWARLFLMFFTLSSIIWYLTISSSHFQVPQWRCPSDHWSIPEGDHIASAWRDKHGRDGWTIRVAVVALLAAPVRRRKLLQCSQYSISPHKI